MLENLVHDLFLLLTTNSGTGGVVILKLEGGSTQAGGVVPKLGGGIYSQHLLALQFVATHPTWDNHRSNLVIVIHKLTTYHK